MKFIGLAFLMVLVVSMAMAREDKNIGNVGVPLVCKTKCGRTQMDCLGFRVKKIRVLRWECICTDC